MEVLLDIYIIFIFFFHIFLNFISFALFGLIYVRVDCNLDKNVLRLICETKVS